MPEWISGWSSSFVSELSFFPSCFPIGDMSSYVHIFLNLSKRSVSWVLPLGPREERVQGGCSFYCHSPWCCRQGFHHFLLFTRDKDHGKLFATVLSLPGQLPRQPCRRSRVHCFCSYSGWRLLEQIWIPVGASGVHHPKVILPEGAEWSSTMKLET